MQRIRNILKTWLTLAAAVTLLTGVMYAVVQQVFRSLADEPQIQMAEDGAHRIAAGESPESILPPETVDIGFSLAPYIIVFDSDGNPLASNAVLHGEIPELPDGVLDFAAAHNGHRVSYQPEPAVRSATVIVPVDGGEGGFVLAGRSLREVEAGEAQLVKQLIFGWLGTLFGTLVVVGVLEVVLGKRGALSRGFSQI